MRNIRNAWHSLLVFFCLAGMSVQAGDDEVGGRAALRRTIEYLSSISSRVTGYAGCDEAAAYVEMRFRELGLTDIVSEDFKLAVPVDRGALLVAGEGENAVEIPIHGLWPNMVRTSKLPPTGVSGRLVYGRGGYMVDFNGKEVEDSVVLMDFSSSTRWLNAAQLGAKAILFIEPPMDIMFRTDAEEKFFEIPLPMPRYWISKANLTKLMKALGVEAPPVESRRKLELRLQEVLSKKPHSVQIKADMGWEMRTARNIIAAIPGTDRELRKDTILIESYYDSVSVVPGLAPGAESACGLAAMLELARWAVKHPPRRTLQFVATAGHFEALSGIREYAKKHYYTLYEPEESSEQESREEQKADLERAEREGVRKPGHLMISLDLSSGENQLALFYKGHFYNQWAAWGEGQEGRHQRQFIRLAEQIMRYYEDMDSAEFDSALLNGVVPRRDRDWQSMVPGRIALNSEAVSLTGQQAVAFITANDSRSYVDTPLDLVQNIRFDNLEAQTRLLIAIFDRILNDPELPLTDKLQQGWVGDSFGKVTEDLLLAYLPEMAIPDALVGVLLTNETKPLLGVRPRAYTISESHGLFEFFGLDRNASPYWRNVVAFKLDPKDGGISWALKPAAEDRQFGLTPTWWRTREKDWTKRAVDIRLPVFRCTSWVVYDLIDQLELQSLGKLTVLDASTNAKPQKAVYFLGQAGVGTSFSEPCAVAFTEPDTRVKLTMEPLGSGIQQQRLTLLNVPPGIVTVVAIQSKKELATFRGHEGEEVDAVAFAPDGVKAASAGESGLCRVWPLAVYKEGEALKGDVLQGHTKRVNDLDFSPDGRYLVSASDDYTCRIWDWKEAKEIHRFEQHKAPVLCARFSPDGRRVVSGAADGTVWIWRLHTEKEGRAPSEDIILAGHGGGVNAVAFDAQGQRVASASDDMSCRVWDAATGKGVCKFEGHRAAVNTVAFSPDGKRLASGADDATCRVWNAEDGTGQIVFEGHTGDILTLVFSQDGNQIVTGSDDGTCRRFDAATGRELQRQDVRAWDVVRVALLKGEPIVAMMDPSRRKESQEGFGFEPAVGKSENFIYNTSYRVARDMWGLDAYRIEKLRETGIANKRVDELHSLAGRCLRRAKKSWQQKDYDRFLDAVRSSWAFESGAYPHVHRTANDVLVGIMFYFAVLMPFVYFSERLFIAAADIRRQLMWLAIIFLIVYLVLHGVHPALRLSSTPIIIIDGFFMIALGLLVIFYILGKFNQQMEDARAKSTFIHRTDVARGSAAAAAFLLGISNMRKRKVRTVLTCVTLILLTFSLLSLASFETELRSYRMATEYDKPYEGVLLRRLNWAPIEEHAYYTLLEHFRDAGGLCCLRSWISPERGQSLSLDVTNVENPRWGAYAARGILGLDPHEPDLTGLDRHHLKGARWFTGKEERYPFVCLLPKRMADDLGIKLEPNRPQPQVRLLGSDLDVIGIFDDSIGMLDHIHLEHFRKPPEDEELEECKKGEVYACPYCGEQFASKTGFYGTTDLDSEPLTPVDFAEMQERQEEQESLDLQEEDESATKTTKSELLPDPDDYYHQDPGNVVIVPNDLAIKMGATIRSVGVKLEGQKVKPIVEKFTQRTNLLVFTGVPVPPEDEARGSKGVYLYRSRGQLAVKGIANLLVPMAIAGLIVFNTMLGSVYERMKEISIYASVGLAPMHISALFLAESTVYAIIGAVVGYLIGQVGARFLTLNFPNIGLNLNYSSTAAVWATVMVIVIVILSTAYPARRAAQLSVPDETRKMKLPKPEGDVWKFVFPFTVSHTETIAASMFLYDYFISHDEDALEGFTADEMALAEERRDGKAAYILTGKVWIQPLDMGISQRVQITTYPDPTDDQLYLMEFEIHRESGEVEAWERMNVGFLRLVRKQLLIWRLVEANYKKRLDMRGRALLARRPVPPQYEEEAGELGTEPTADGVSVEGEDDEETPDAEEFGSQKSGTAT
ncbi:MAG: FtsX-like permease family protein [Planctomycetota bacterium]